MLCTSLSTIAAAQLTQLSGNVRAGGIDSYEREQAGSRIRRGLAEGLVRAPLDVVMAAVLDYGGYRRFMPHFLASRVLSQRGSEALIYIEVEALQGLVRLWAELRLQVFAPNGPTRVISARMLKGNIKSFDARWRLTPTDDGRTLVVFELCVDPDFGFAVPASLVSRFNEVEARSSVLRLRSYIVDAGRNAKR